MSFTQYFSESLNGIFTNSLFIGIILAIIVQDIRNYLRPEHRFIKKKGFEWNIARFLMYLFSYVVAVPVGIAALTIVIWFLWLISLMH